MKRAEHSEVQTALEAGLYQHSRSRWLAALFDAWISILALCIVSINFTTRMIDTLPAVARIIIYTIGYGVALVYLASALYTAAQQLKNPQKLKLTADEVRMLGLDPALVPHIKADTKETTPAPTSPLAWATKSPEPTPVTSPAKREYVSPYRGGSPVGSAPSFYSSPSGAGSPAPYSGSPYRSYERPEDSPFRGRSETRGPSSPVKATSPTKAGAYTSDRELEAFLSEQESMDISRGRNVGPQTPDRIRGYGSVTAVTQQLPIYKTMPKPDSSTKKSATGDDLNNSVLAAELYRSLQITDRIHSWGGKMRVWFIKRPLRHTLAWMDRVEKELGRDALYQSQLSQVQMGVNVVQNQQNNFSVNPLAFQGAANNPQQQRFMGEYMKLERYFGEYGNSREYVVDRIRVLGKDTCLQNYKWNAGEDKTGKWTTDLPADAQILAHLFSCYMDEKLSATVDHKTNKPQLDAYNIFSAKHFIRQKGGKPKSYVSLYQTSVTPPHYNLMVSKEKSQGEFDEWVVAKGYNNLFHALSLLVFYIYKNHKGYFRQLQLGSPDIGLLDCISDWDNDSIEYAE